MLIGNKSDLANEQKVTREQAMGFAERFNVSYMETSAKDGSNVEHAFVELVRSIYQNMSNTA